MERKLHLGFISWHHPTSQHPLWMGHPSSRTRQSQGSELQRERPFPLSPLDGSPVTKDKTVSGLRTAERTAIPTLHSGWTTHHQGQDGLRAQDCGETSHAHSPPWMGHPSPRTRRSQGSGLRREWPFPLSTLDGSPVSKDKTVSGLRTVERTAMPTLRILVPHSISA